MSQTQPPVPGYGPNQPQISPAEERQWGMISHAVPAIAMVLSAGTLGFVVSLVIYVLYKDKGPFVRSHAANSLNVQIMTLIYLLISIPLLFVLVGFLTFPLAFIYALVLHVMGAIKANNGEWWQPPFTLKLVS